MTNPKPDKLPRVLRGGTWFDSDSAVVIAACRFTYTPSIRADDVGFRTTLRGSGPRV